jgi:hypothetical protein
MGSGGTLGFFVMTFFLALATSNYCQSIVGLTLLTAQFVRYELIRV